MKVKVPSAFTKSNGIDPVAAGERLHQRRGLLHHQSPLDRLLGLKVAGAVQVTNSIQQTPSQQRSWIRMMAEDPTVIAPNLMLSQVLGIGMKGTDATAGINRRSLVCDHK